MLRVICNVLTQVLLFAARSYLSWLGLVTLCYLYNILTIILRTAFQAEGYYSPSNYHFWLAADYCCDFIYLLDLVLIKPRVQFIKNGLLQVS